MWMRSQGCWRNEQLSVTATAADDEIVARLGNWAKTKKFRLDKTIIELRGTCETCANA